LKEYDFSFFWSDTGDEEDNTILDEILSGYKILSPLFAYYCAHFLGGREGEYCQFSDNIKPSSAINYYKEQENRYELDRKSQV
jgi:hypothetical protein